MSRDVGGDTFRLIARHEQLLREDATHAASGEVVECSNDAGRLLRLLETMRQLGCRRESPAEAPSMASIAERAASDDRDQTFGRFRILRELGRGGHGIVFLAQDPKLDRNIALKVPRIETLVSTELRQRFLREAVTVARLDHPCLVPVYEVGAIGPVCYIASQYCSGPSLAEWIRDHEEPIDLCLAARIIARLAETVEFVHQHGVLHRDIKPGNVLMDFAHGFHQQGDNVNDGQADAFREVHVKLTDFGLARLADEATNLTRTGKVAGTPAYMAPEQADGGLSAVGSATDVYGLGAILYELLTGRPPFQGESDREVLRRISEGALSPPGRVRHGIPRDLEAICLKCLEIAPRARYASAGELSDDLARFLQGKSTWARPIGRVGRIVKWSRRKPAVAGLSAVLILALAAGLGLASWQQSRIAIGQSEAEQNLRLATLAVQDFQVALEQSIADHTPELSALRRAMLQEALRCYQTFLSRDGNDPVLRANVGKAHYHLGFIASGLGHKHEASRHFERALPIWEELTHGQPNVADHWYFLSKVCSHLALVQCALGRPEIALPLYERALRIVDTQLPEHLGERQTLTEDARLLSQLGSLHNTQGNFELALTFQERAREISRQLLKSQPDSPELQIRLGDACRKVAQVQKHLRQYQQALMSCERAVELFKLAEAGQHLQREAEHAVARTFLLAGCIHKSRHDCSAAEQSFRQAQQHYQQLVREFPNRPQFKLELAINCRHLAQVYSVAGDLSRVTQCFQDAVEIHRRLCREYPESIHFTRRFADAYYAMGNAYRKSGHLEEALACLQHAAGLNPDNKAPEIRTLASKLVDAYEAAQCDDESRASANVLSGLAQAHEIIDRFSRLESDDDGCVRKRSE